MESSIIAVRVANGGFVPVLDTSGKTRRRLVLTTIRDDQTNVQIDLYRGNDETMEQADYIGSLMIENIEPAAKGQADIALLLGVDESGNLNATATDKNSGEYQSLSVGLESVEQDGGYDMPDFELNDEELTLEELTMDEEEIALDESAASLSLDDVTLEEDLSLDPESEPSTDTLAASATEGLAGLEDFAEESVSFDESLSDEMEMVDSEETDADFATDELPDLDDGMVEADLGDEDFAFDEPGEEDVLADIDLEPAGEMSPESVEADENIFEDLDSQEEPALEPSIEVGDSDVLEADMGGEVSDEFGADDAFGSDATFAADEAVPGEYGASAEPLAPRRSNGIIYVGYLILSLAALGVLTYLVFRLLEGPPAPALQASLPLLLVAWPRRKRSRRNRDGRQVR